MASIDERVPAASTTAAGKVELATAAESLAGTDAVRAVTPQALLATVTGKTNLLRTRTVWALGDSLTEGSSPGGGGITYDATLFSSKGQPCLQYQEGSWVPFAVLASQARWRVGGIFATGGWSAAQILATYVSAVIAAASPGDTVVVTASTNLNVLADVKTIHATLRAAGLNTVAVTIPPNTDTGAATLLTLTGFNAGLRKYAADNGIPSADDYTAMLNPATGAYVSGYAEDAVHPSVIGNKVFGETIAAVLNGFFPATRPRFRLQSAPSAGSQRSSPCRRCRTTTSDSGSPSPGLGR